jgi:hypothetical protein
MQLFIVCRRLDILVLRTFLLLLLLTNQEDMAASKPSMADAYLARIQKSNVLVSAALFAAWCPGTIVTANLSPVGYQFGQTVPIGMTLAHTIGFLLTYAAVREFTDATVAW